MKAGMLIGKYIEIVESLYIKPKNNVIVGSFIEKNDYDIEQRYNRRYQNFFQDAEKRGSGETEKIQENVLVDIIEID